MKLLTSALIVLGLGMAIPAVAQEAAPVAAPTATAAPAAAAPAATPAAAAPAEKVAAPAPLKPDAEYGQPVDKGYALPPQVTKNGQFALWMHNVLLMPIITIISVFVLGLLLWVMFRYRKAANPIPSKTSHNTLIEVIWTLVPVLILVGIAIPSIGLLAAQYKPVGKDAITIKAIGNQWFWTYEYPDHGGFEVVSNMLPDAEAKKRGEPRLLAVDNRIVVPVNVPIRVLTTSNDVIHSFAMPAFWTKMDAVPGRLNETSFTAERVGLYYGQCSELCGARHGFMPIAIEVVPQAQFEQWVKSKGGTMPGSKPAATEPVGSAAPQAPAAVTAAAAEAPAANASTPANATAPAAAK
ncbi:MAG: cytochrome c oxidase subunit II [Pseudomonadota bacterium]